MERPKLAQPATSVSAAAAASSTTTTITTGGAALASSVLGPDKRRKLEEASKESRIDAKQVIDDLIKSANLGHESADGILFSPL